MITIWTAVLSGSVAILLGILTHYFTKVRELEMKEAEYKLERYKEFLSALGRLGSGFKTYEAHVDFINAINTLNLLASKSALSTIYELVAYIETHKGNYDVTEQNKILKRLVLEIRRDLYPKAIEGFEHFDFHFFAQGLRPGENVDTLKNDSKPHYKTK